MNYIKALIVIVLIAVPQIVFGAIAYDNFTQSKTTGTSLTFAHTTSGSNRLLVIGISNQSDSGSDIGASDVSYNGDTATYINKYTNPQNDTVYMYYLINPDSGSNNVVINRADATGTVQARVWSITGAKQSAQPDAHATANTTTGTLTSTVTNVSANTWSVLMAYNQEGGTISASTNSTARGATDLYSRLFDNSGVAPTAGTGAYSMTVTRPSGASVWQSVIASFAPHVDIPGCTDPDATNYNSSATTDDGSCTYASGSIDFSQASSTFYTITGFRFGAVLDYIQSFPTLIIGLFIHIIEELLPITVVVIAISAILYIIGKAWRFFNH